MPDVSVIKTRGVIDGLTVEQAKALASNLPTDVERVGDRLKFRPTRPVLDELVERGFKFAPECREAWGRFYKASNRDDVEFSFKLEPYDHQREHWSKVKDKRVFAFEWEMGLGKSKVALDVGAWQYACGVIDAVLVITLKGVHRKWIEHDVPENVAIPHTAAAWHATRVGNGVKSVDGDARGMKIAAINFDAVNFKKGWAFVNRFLDENRCMIIVDESHHIKTHNSKRTKNILKLAAKAKSRMILTGTPITASPLDAWSQYAFLDSDILGLDFYEFKNRYAVQKELPGVTHEVWRKDPITGRGRKVEENVKIIVGYTKLEELRTVVDNYRSRLLKTDVLDLPPKVYRTHAYELSKDDRKAYETLRTEMFLELGDDRYISAPMALTMLTRLRQMLAGFVMPDDADPTSTLGEAFSTSRVDALRDVVSQIDGQTIIWANYRFSVQQIADMLRTGVDDEQIGVYTGATSDDERSRIVRDFASGKVRYFVGNPQVGGTGINLTAARDVVYFDNNYRLDLRLQSEDRAHRIGQTGSVTYTDIEALDTVDAKIIKALRDKQDIAEIITGDSLRKLLSKA